MPVRRILLVGGGRGHLEVLRRFAQQPDAGIDLTLASPSALAPYSPMLAEVVAGHCSVGASQIELPTLARWARARFVCDRAIEIDLYARYVRLAEGGIEPFDLLSLDLGAFPDYRVPGTREHALSLHPTDHFLAGWAQLEADVDARAVHTVAVVGAGASVVELLLAMQYRLSRISREGTRFALVSDAAHLLEEQTPALRKRLGKILVARDVVLHTGTVVTAVEQGGVVTSTGRRIAADRVVWARPAAGAAWVAASTLACDARGLLRVSASLQSVSDPFVFGVGRCSTREGATAPHGREGTSRSDGALLDANLRRAARHEPLVSRRPGRSMLSVIAAGSRHAVASWGPLLFEGERLWRWKERRDRAHAARYDAPVAKVPLVAKAEELIPPH